MCSSHESVSNDTVSIELSSPSDRRTYVSMLRTSGVTCSSSVAATSVTTGYIGLICYVDSVTLTCNVTVYPDVTYIRDHKSVRRGISSSWDSLGATH